MTMKNKTQKTQAMQTDHATHLPETETEEAKTSSVSSLSAPAVQTRKHPGKVTVFYNHPRAIIFTVTDNHGVERQLEINGNAANLRGLPKGILPACGAYGRTPNVDGELWEAVERKYSKMPAFRNGLIFAVDTGEAAKSELASRAELRNGYEPIDPNRAKTEPADGKD